MTANGAETTSILPPVMDGISLRHRDVSTLTEVDEQIDRLFE